MANAQQMYPSQEARADIEMRVTSLQMALQLPNRTNVAADVTKDAGEIYEFIKQGLDAGSEEVKTAEVPINVQ
jgi:hypothetical protein